MCFQGRDHSSSFYYGEASGEVVFEVAALRQESFSVKLDESAEVKNAKEQGRVRYNRLIVFQSGSLSARRGMGLLRGPNRRILGWEGGRSGLGRLACRVTSQSGLNDGST